MNNSNLKNIYYKKYQEIVTMKHAHYHNSNELYYMAKGSTTYYIGDQIFPINEGDWVFIPSGTLHKTDYEKTANSERYLIKFTNNLFSYDLKGIEKELREYRVIRTEPVHTPYLESLLVQILSESDNDTPYSKLLTNQYITILLIQLCRYRCDYKSALFGEDETMYKLSQYISLHFHEPISLSTLSKTFSMSISRLSKTFKAHTGIGIIEYISYVRISNAEKLLVESNYSITEIAGMCGFNDSNYFSTVFKSVKNVSPKEYRKQQKQKGETN